jgi:two-component system NtrC family sensor kinase
MSTALFALPPRTWAGLTRASASSVRRTMKPSTIVGCTVACVALLGLGAFWDGSRESAASLDDFAREEATLAREVASALRSSARITELPYVRDAFDPIEEPGQVAAVYRAPGMVGLRTSSGAAIDLPRLAAALDSTPCRVEDLPSLVPCSLRLSHEESMQLGLPGRMGMAGLATFDGRGGTRWGVAIITTAARERDRERRAAARVVLSFLVSSGLVLALGTLALRKQRRELAMAGELAVEEAVRARDERLVRADKLATLGALATGIAHEVSTPLGVIVGRAEQLAPKVADDAKATRAVTAILEQTTRIEEIIRAFLTLARGGTPSLEHIDPREVARAAVELVLHRFAQTNVNVATLTGDLALPPVACERRLMEQAVVNLLLNACDACSAGGNVSVDVRLDDGRVSFVVRDDGAGITEEAALRATEPFFTTKPEGKGTGLGLAITREIVHHHQGTLSVAARKDGRGTEARITLPIVSVGAPS